MTEFEVLNVTVLVLQVKVPPVLLQLPDTVIVDAFAVKVLPDCVNEPSFNE
jgi:hypothetical protein